MIYFIPWAVFLLVCIVAVPVASVMEKRKRLRAMEGLSEDVSDSTGEEIVEEAEVEIGDQAGFGDAEFGAAEVEPSSDAEFEGFN
ncbi:hypothetical protein OAH34_01125 [bacterium]|nr:hypothetical protein [bacterium]